MKKHILLTVIMGIFLAFIIYKVTYHDEMKILGLGDGIALGMTSYNVEGYSYNDYLKDYYEKNSILREYNTEFATLNETSKSLLEKINNNEKLESNNITIQQAISQAKIITLGIGMEELNNLTEIKSKYLENYLSNMDNIIKQIRIFNKNEIFLLSLYSSTKLKGDQLQQINERLQQIAQDNNCKYIDIEIISEKKEYFFKPKSFYLNYKGHHFISELIIDQLN